MGCLVAVFALFYETYLKQTFKESLILATENRYNGYMYFMFNKNELSISEVKNIIKNATLI